jgi:hypothetical protein
MHQPHTPLMVTANLPMTRLIPTSVGTTWSTVRLSMAIRSRVQLAIRIKGGAP